ncbi:MAG: DUF2339 domain-containing protein [Flavobacteriaceae bacterium]|nr:DUF2339 domain-containing protein [Flavobacteriaceae bacterium]
MEPILYIIIIIILITNNRGIKSLKNQIENLKKDLKNTLHNKSKQKITLKKELIDEKIITKPDLLISKIEKEEEEEEGVFKTHQDKVKKIIEEKPKKVDPIIIIKPMALKPKKAPVFQKTLSNRFTAFKKRNPDLETFIGENLISKIGILILVLGISFFVKYAIDQEWINEIGRVGIGFLSGTILLGFAHKLHKNYKAFSAILVSGAIVVFYFIIAYAFKEYKLYSQTTAFILMVITTIFSTAISILYNRKELGVLSLIGGFLVPVLVSTGSGNFIVLFIYLLILNIGFLVVSIKKKWFIINILAFIFTHLFFINWITSDSDILVNANTLFLFATLFYIVFFIMNIFKVVKESKQELKPQIILLFLISTFVYFGEGLYLLGYFLNSFKGLFTLLLALVNLGAGWILLQKNSIDKKTVYLFIGMTLTLLTLTGPMQLEGNYITLFWATESVLLIWLSQKIKNNDLKIVAFITLFLTISSLTIDFIQIYESPKKLKTLFNKGFLTGIFTVISLVTSAFLLKREKETYTLRNIKINPTKIAVLLTVIASIVLYLTGLLELTHQTNNYLDVFLATTIITIYHYIAIIVVMSYLFKYKITHTVALIVSVISILVGANFLSQVPFNSFKNSILDHTANPTFYVQIILLGLLFYNMKLSYDHINKQEYSTKNKNYFSYFLASFIVILISLELLIISQPIVVSPKINTLTAVNSEIYNLISNSKTTVIKTSFPILWGVLSFIFLYFGIKNAKKTWRIFSLILIALTIIKLFTYDIENVSQGGKIIAFILLGIVLLIISFMYQKIKKTFFKDEENKK